MLEGPYKSNSSWVGSLITNTELIGLVVGFLAGCYFLVKAALTFYVAGAFLQLFAIVAVALVLCIVALFTKSIWRVVAVFLFASVGPFLVYLFGQ